MKLLNVALTVGLIGIASLSAQAATVNACDVDSWKITAAVPSSLYSTIGLQSVGPISATSCAGV